MNLKDALIAEEQESSRETITATEAEALATGGKKSGRAALSLLIYLFILYTLIILSFLLSTTIISSILSMTFSCAAGTRPQAKKLLYMEQKNIIPLNASFSAKIMQKNED